MCAVFAPAFEIGAVHDVLPACVCPAWPGPDLGLSLEAVIATSGRSRRTWWRRVQEGAVAKLGTDGRGRLLLRLLDVAAALPGAGRLGAEDWLRLTLADGGDVQAQADVGALLALWAQEVPGSGERGAGSVVPGRCVLAGAGRGTAAG